VNGIGQGAPAEEMGGSANRVLQTIWDGGGIDTYDFSNYTSKVVVNLAPGSGSATSSASEPISATATLPAPTYTARFNTRAMSGR
jgi:hypothetical protein